MVKFSTSAELFPLVVTEAELPGKPVVVVPTVTVVDWPVGPVGPAGPMLPCASSDQTPPFPELVSGSCELLPTVAMYVEPPKVTASFVA
jgi:hypothetical protein